MKKIRVLLKYPWKFPDSSHYKYLIENPPKKVEYIYPQETKNIIINKKKFLFLNILKKLIRSIPNRINFPILNLHNAKSVEKIDLIHCAHCMVRTEKPWVADFESWWQFWISGEEKYLRKNKIKKIILSKNCKKIMPWTNRIKEDILDIMPELKDKLEVVYPAVPRQELKKNKNKKLTILYASRYFWIKGGLVALEVLKSIKKDFDVNIIFISSVPSEIKEKYKMLNIINVVQPKELKKIYQKSDIFFYPSFIDTFGFSLLEAMSYGLSILTINTGGTTSCKEIVEHKKTGIIVDFQEYEGNKIYRRCRHIKEKELVLIGKLIFELKNLIKNKNLRKRLSKNSLREIRSGKFSIERRNKSLRRIYEEATRKRGENKKILQ